MNETKEEETRKQDSPHWILCDLSGLDRSSRHIDEEQLFSCNLMTYG